ncbi:MAG: HAD family hydrolase [Alphaproteobacteria bacterium]
MTIKFCIFDVGQVCYPYSLEPLNQLLREQSADHKTFDKKGGAKSFNYNSFMKGETDFTAFCKNLCGHCGIVYSKDIEQSVDNAMHQGVGPFYEETLETMSWLRKEGIEIGLLSNALPNLADTGQTLAAEDKIFVSYELGLLKPDKAIYQSVLEKLNAKPEEVIFIDDKRENVEAAKSLGINGIVFDRNTISRQIKTLITQNNFLTQHFAKTR